MNDKRLNLLSEKLNLGQIKTLKNIPSGPGGWSLVWKVITEKNQYCIKELPDSISLKDNKIITKYNLCESIASRLSEQGIPAVHAMKFREDYITVIENKGYLVYPWIEGYIQKDFSESHAIKIAEVLANIHKLNLDAPEIQQKFDRYTNDSILDTINQSVSLNKPFAKKIKENQSMIFSLNDAYQKSVLILSETSVLTHGDMNKSNVLWNEKDEPFLIDWEAIKKMNPTQEIIRTALSWGIPENVSYETMLTMISVYKKSCRLFNKNHIEAAFNSIFGSQIFWLMLHLKMALDDQSGTQDNKTSNQINIVLLEMKKLKDHIPDLISKLKTD